MAKCLVMLVSKERNIICQRVLRSFVVVGRILTSSSSSPRGPCGMGPQGAREKNRLSDTRPNYFLPSKHSGEKRRASEPLAIWKVIKEDDLSGNDDQDNGVSCII